MQVLLELRGQQSDGGPGRAERDAAVASLNAGTGLRIFFSHISLPGRSVLLCSVCYKHTCWARQVAVCELCIVSGDVLCTSVDSSFFCHCNLYPGPELFSVSDLYNRFARPFGLSGSALAIVRSFWHMTLRLRALFCTSFRPVHAAAVPTSHRKGACSVVVCTSNTRRLPYCPHSSARAI
jgi:hypothetical protein